MILEGRPGTHSLDEITAEVRTLLALIPDLSYMTGVEVGTLRGRTASLLCAHRPGLRLTCVDNWDCDDIIDYEPRHAVRQAALRNLDRWGYILIEEASPGCAENFDDASYDFVYLDAKHDYASVVADIAAWWPKVRPGGLLCGHDYGREKPAGIKGLAWNVKAAVDAFALGLELYVEGVVWACKKA